MRALNRQRIATRGRARIAGVAAAAALLFVALSATSGPRDRYGVMGKILAYDSERKLVRVGVVETSIPQTFNAVGGSPPNDIRAGSSYTFAVQPEGSVLSRTVIKTRKGWAADNSGTQEGFDRAMASLPDDRLLGLSFAENPEEGDVPPYKLMLIHIPITREEFMERLDAITVDEGGD